MRPWQSYHMGAKFVYPAAAKGSSQSLFPWLRSNEQRAMSVDASPLTLSTVLSQKKVSSSRAPVLPRPFLTDPVLSSSPVLHTKLPSRSLLVCEGYLPVLDYKMSLPSCRYPRKKFSPYHIFVMVSVSAEPVNRCCKFVIQGAIKSTSLCMFASTTSLYYQSYLVDYYLLREFK